MAYVLPRRDSEQVKCEMLRVQYVDLGDGSGPVALGTTDESTHIQCIRNPAWKEPVIGTVEGGLYDLLPSQCVLPLVGCPELFWHDVFRYWMWLLKDDVRSKTSRKNLASVTTLIGVLSSRISGSGKGPTCWQQCTRPVFEFEKLKPFSCIHVWTLFTQNCTALSTLHNDLP